MARRRWKMAGTMGASTSVSKPDCPQAPAARLTTYSRTLHRACLILGGVREFAEHVRSPESSLRAWLEGAEEPPEEVFFAAVEIILLHAEDPGRAN
jgi:hypothetical protein